MEFPIEIQRLIKEFSMPKYKKPTHFKAFNKSTKLEKLGIHLNPTPYTRVEIAFNGSNYINDLIRVGEFGSYNDVDYDFYYEEYLHTILGFLDDEEIEQYNNLYFTIEYDSELELTDFITLLD